MPNKSMQNLSNISWLPFNNFMHYLRHKNVDLTCVLGLEPELLVGNLGGNCIYKSVLAASVLQSVSDSVYSVIGKLGTHHALVYFSGNELFFYDSCLFMDNGLKIDVDFACQETLLAPFSSGLNYVAFERQSASVFTSVWGLNLASVSKTWSVCFDLQNLNQIPRCDWAVEAFKSLPYALIFRYFNSVSGCLQQLSLFLSSRQIFVSKSFSQNFTPLHDVSVGFESEFLESVSVPLKYVVDCMFLALELVDDFERWE